MYPRRESFWAHKLVRILIRTCAVNDIGPYGFMLVTIIAHQEDAKQYTDAPGYWNDQLVSQLACGSVETLNRARVRAVENGWLHYIPGGKGKIGKYWTCIPKKFETIAPSAVDEDMHIILRTSAEDTSRIGGGKQEDKHGRNERTTAEHSNLSLSPSPIPIPFWLSVHAKDPSKEAENRAAYADLVAHHPQANAIGDALRFSLGRKVYLSELVDAVLKSELEKRLAATPATVDPVLESATAKAKEIGLEACKRHLDCGDTLHSIRDVLEALAGNQALCFQLIARTKDAG